MFTLGAFVLLGLVGWGVRRIQDRERPEYGHLDEPNALLLLHIRQDIRLIATMLGGVIIMLGLIADRIG
jgi:hypothetical protein